MTIRTASDFARIPVSNDFGASKDTPVVVLDLAKGKLVKGEGVNLVCKDFTSAYGNSQKCGWESGRQYADRNPRFLAVTGTERNLHRFEEWLHAEGYRKVAWKLRAMFPEVFFFDPEAWHRQIARIIARFV